MSGRALRLVLEIEQALQRLRRRSLPARLSRLFYDRLTPAGRALLLLWLGAGLLGQNMVPPIYGLWAFASVSLLLAVLLARRLLDGELRFRRLPIPDSTAGDSVTMEVEVENLSRRTLRQLSCLELDPPPGIRGEWQHAPVVVARLAPGAKVVIPIRLRCVRRGAYTLQGLHLASSWPLGLWRALRGSPQSSSLLVYPSFRTPSEFPLPEGSNHQPGGILLSSEVGESPEFMHTREWRSGDNPRHVHWASSARRGKPIVRVYHQEYFVRQALVLDTQVAAGERAEQAFEWALSTAAGIADYLSRRDYIIDIFAAGARVYHFQAGRALAHLEHILRLLACLQPSRHADWEALGEALVPEAPRLTSVVCLFNAWDPPRRELVGLLRSLGVATRVIVVSDEQGLLPLAAEPGAEAVRLAPGRALSLPAAGGAGGWA